MNVYKKIYAIATTLILLLNPFISNAYADSFQVIHEETQSEVLAEGITHTYIERFTTSGWLDINIIEVELNDKNVDLDALYGLEGLNQPSTVSSMAKEVGAVAAINGDFFDTKTGSPIGQIVSNGALISGPPDKSLYGKLSSFNMDNDGNIFFEYWTYDFNVTLPDGNLLTVSAFNKATSGQYLSLYDYHWGNTPGSNGNPNHIEVIVDDDGTILEVRQNMPGTAIPEGCYALVANGDSAVQLSALSTGEKIEIKLSTKPEYKNLKLSLSGGTLLVKDGAIAPITHDPVPKPTARTSIGINKNGDRLFLVTVDGRNGSSIGLLESEMAQLMLDIGTYNALNFDGGGSTTMVARPLGEKSVVTVNVPSDGKERRVADAIGVFNNVESGDIKGLKIKSEGNAFVGSHTNISVFAYDDGYNPLDVNMDRVTFSLSGVKGKFEGNCFMPQSAGQAVITVKYKGVSEKININVLDKPIILKSNISAINTGYNTQTEIKVYGKDVKGYTALIPPDDIEWTVHGNPGNIENGIFTSGAANASGYITAEFNGVYLSIPVSVGNSTQKIDFPSNINLEEVDPYNKKIDVKNDMSSYNIFVYGNTEASNLLQNLMLSRAIDKANETSSFAVFMGKGSEKLNNLKIPYIAIDSPGLYEFRNSSFIVLDSSKGGLRATNAEQWFALKEYLNKAEGTNIFLVLPTPVWGSGGFADQREATLLEKTLKDFRSESGKNVWILYQGNQNFYTALNDEIRYIGLSGTTNINKSDISTMPYTLIEINENEIYYQKNNLFK
ncbi:MAG: phosphodiester glycosidase family protein [Thermoanaerobacteraceae bacterium]|nr:phosphodiester glycosidase family protein [Thermoanaerobacteraceae bacterium]